MRYLWYVLLLCIGGFLYSNSNEIWPKISAAWQQGVAYATSVALGTSYVSPQKTPVQSVQVDLYVAAGCKPCRQLEQNMTGAGIKYTEYFLDNNIPLQKQLTSRLQQAGYRGRAPEPPILFVGNGVFMSPPSIDAIRAVMDTK